MSITRRRTLGFASALAALGGTSQGGLASVLSGARTTLRSRNAETAQRLLALLIHQDESHHEPHSAMIWIPARDTAWFAINTMDAPTYARLNRQYKKRGYRLQRVSAFKTHGGVRYAAIWELVKGPDWHSRHGMTLAAFNRARTEFAGRGWRLSHVDARVDYSAIWERGDAAGQQCVVAQSATDFAQQMTSLSAQGFRPLRISTGVANTAPNFTAIFEKSPSVPWQAQHMMTAAQFAQTDAKMKAQGFKLIDASGHMFGKAPNFTGIWEQI